MKDICNELDVRSLCHKILQNVSILLKADRGSLFLVEGKSSDDTNYNINSTKDSAKGGAKDTKHDGGAVEIKAITNEGASCSTDDSDIGISCPNDDESSVSKQDTSATSTIVGEDSPNNTKEDTTDTTTDGTTAETKGEVTDTKNGSKDITKEKTKR